MQLAQRQPRRSAADTRLRDARRRPVRRASSARRASSLRRMMPDAGAAPAIGCLICFHFHFIIYCRRFHHFIAMTSLISPSRRLIDTPPSLLHVSHFISPASIRRLFRFS
jgi:hypothetical protein